MDQTPSNRRSYWQFSLRELLLLMVAAAALIGWGAVVYRSQRLKPSSFFEDNENWHAEVAAVFQELGEPPFTGAAGTVMHSEGTAANQRTFIFRLPLPADKIGSFRSLLVNRVRAKLTSAACKVAGEASGTGANDVRVIGYTNGPVSGTIQIAIGSADNGRVTVILTMVEQQGMSTGFGLINRGD